MHCVCLLHTHLQLFFFYFFVCIWAAHCVLFVLLHVTCLATAGRLPVADGFVFVVLTFIVLLCSAGIVVEAFLY